jgi:hypothetical protein
VVCWEVLPLPPSLELGLWSHPGISSMLHWMEASPVRVGFQVTGSTWQRPHGPRLRVKVAADAIREDRAAFRYLVLFQSTAVATHTPAPSQLTSLPPVRHIDALTVHKAQA